MVKCQAELLLVQGRDGFLHSFFGNNYLYFCLEG